MLPIDCNLHPDSRNNPILKRYTLETLKYGRIAGKNSSFLVGRQWHASGVLCSDSPWCYSGTYVLCSFIDPFSFSVHRIQIYLAFFFFWKYNANVLEFCWTHKESCPSEVLEIKTANWRPWWLSTSQLQHAFHDNWCMEATLWNVCSGKFSKEDYGVNSFDIIWWSDPPLPMCVSDLRSMSVSWQKQLHLNFSHSLPSGRVFLLSSITGELRFGT